MVKRPTEHYPRRGLERGKKLAFFFPSFSELVGLWMQTEDQYHYTWRNPLTFENLKALGDHLIAMFVRLSSTMPDSATSSLSRWFQSSKFQRKYKVCDEFHNLNSGRFDKAWVLNTWLSLDSFTVGEECKTKFQWEILGKIESRMTDIFAKVILG